MNAASIGSLLAGTAAKVTANISVGIWRNSYDVDDIRAKVGRPFGDGSAKQGFAVIDAIVETMKEYAKASKPAGKVHDLPCNMIETFYRIMRFTTFKTGDCQASYKMIVDATGFCRDTINRHINALRKAGWLDWVRRTERTDNGNDRTTASQYFFEISRIPLAAQRRLRQLLAAKGITLHAHPERKGSGPVPNLAQRIAERIARGCKAVADKVSGDRRNQALMNEAAFVRSEMAHFGDVPIDQWAKLRHPGDAAAQDAYDARLGISPFFALPSLTLSIESPPED
ncbi:helix-turn-helix domain-containing protein [Sphingobium yanoikuyae]|uniref:helix-turn-helix domain-containing protein n=1 Tax=Sphingobium yanoikuyae TaxID=13690 RepID=UPI00242AA75D|nr:helix-turn-helix domain-containing protein [Sphingobium yanoikuyae]